MPKKIKEPDPKPPEGMTIQVRSGGQFFMEGKPDTKADTKGDEQ